MGFVPLSSLNFVSLISKRKPLADNCLYRPYALAVSKPTRQSYTLGYAHGTANWRTRSNTMNRIYSVNKKNNTPHVHIPKLRKISVLEPNTTPSIGGEIWRGRASLRSCQISPNRCNVCRSYRAKDLKNRRLSNRNTGLCACFAHAADNNKQTCTKHCRLAKTRTGDRT